MQSTNSQDVVNNTKDIYNSNNNLKQNQQDSIPPMQSNQSHLVKRDFMITENFNTLYYQSFNEFINFEEKVNYLFIKLIE